jgi:hypothetical protein
MNMPELSKTAWQESNPWIETVVVLDNCLLLVTQSEPQRTIQPL